MNEHVARIIADTKQFDATVTASMRVLQRFNQMITDATAENRTLSGAEQNLIMNMGKFEVSAKTTEGAVKQLSSMLRELENAYRHMSSEMKNDDFGKGVAKSIEQLQSRLQVAQADLKAMGGDASVAGGKGKGIFSGILGGNLAARAVMDSLRFLKDTVKDAVEANMEFEYSQATLAAVLGQSKEQIMDLTIQAQKLGSTSLYSAKEISELQVILARLGFNKTEIEDSTDAIAKLALATGVSLEHAASLTGATLRAFGYDTKEAARVASVLGVSTTKSALDMEKLKTAMSYASSVARQAGFEIEDVVAMLGKMVDNGQQATTAGVNMRNIMLDLSNKSSKLSRAIKEVTGKEQVRNFDEFVEALRQMRDAGMNLDDVANVVQKRVTPGFLNMVANTEGIAQLRDELKGCTGELDEMADKMENTLTGATKKLSNSWNALMLEFANNNGGITRAITLLDKLIDRMAEARRMRFGGDRLIGFYERDLSEGEKAGTAKNVEALRGQGQNAVSQMEDTVLNERNKIAAKRDRIKEFYDQYVAMYNDFNDALAPFRFEKKKAINELVRQFEEEFPEYIGKMGMNFAQEIASQNFQIKRKDYMLSLLNPELYGNKNVVSASINENEGVDTATKLRLEQARKREADAISAYAESTKIAAMEREQGKIDEKQYNNEMYNATERLYKVYADLAGEFDNPKYKEALEKWWQEMEKFAKAIGELKDKSIQGAMNTLNHRDTRLLRGLQSTAKTAGVSYESVGLDTLGASVMKGDTISDDVFQGVADRLNEVLGKQKYYIAIDFETGSIQKIQKEIFSLGDAVGALQNLSSGFQSLKTSTQDLAETLQGDADGFDKMFAVIDYGLGILQTFVSIQKAIDVLSKMAIATKGAETAATIADTEASIANAAAKGAEASAAGAAAAAEGGKAVAGIPIAGPILAVAAIAAIAGALAAAFSKTEYHAGGGMVGMNGMRPLGTDVVPAMLTPGEIVLNHAQQSNIANQLQGVGRQMVLVQGESYISGDQLRIVYNNSAKHRGVAGRLQ